MKAVMPNEVIRYIPKCDRSTEERPVEPEDQTVFLLKPIRATDAASMQDSSTETSVGGKDKDTVMRILSGTQVLKALRNGLAGWENFKDGEGNQIEFRHNNGNPRPEMFDFIPSKVRQELAEVIIEGMDVSEEQEKN